MKYILQILLFLLLIANVECNMVAPCNPLDSSCNPVSALVLEKAILDSKIPTVEITFNPPGGTYSTNQTVTITTNSSGQLKYLALDTTVPDQPIDCTSGIVYTGPVNLIMNSMALKAVTCVNGIIEKSRTDMYTVQGGAPL